MRNAVFLSVALSLAGPTSLLADEMITTDTVDYCDLLAARMEQQDLPANVRMLLTQGRAMCERGHVMGGLRRIRLAMMIVHRQAAATP